jgi:hypothetical protein
VRVVGVVLIAGLACAGGRTSDERAAVRACQAYARAFAEGAATRCARGDFEANLRAFRASAGVGPACERVAGVRDEAALRDVCLPWITDTADCALFDDPRAYLDALPDACRGQLELGVASSAD